MDRLLARLERRFGKLAIPRIAYVIAITSAVVYALGMVQPRFIAKLVLLPHEVVRGEVWRLITWVFIPPGGSLMWVAIGILFYASLGAALEEAWGSFKLNVYYLIGVLGTVAASMLLGLPMTSATYLHTTVLFAFATLFPNYEFLLFFIIPMRAKWTAWIAAAFLGYEAVKGGLPARVAIGLALANYLLFFGKTLLALAREQGQVARAERRRAQLRAEVEDRPVRKCKICGLTDDDPDADLRVCTCKEVCGGKPTVYCLAHARSHNQQ